MSYPASRAICSANNKTVEIVMQWLDDVEDLVFALLSAWHGICRLCLSLGFAASLLVMAPLAVGRLTLVALTAVAVASVLAWLVAVVSTVIRSTRLYATSA